MARQQKKAKISGGGISENRGGIQRSFWQRSGWHGAHNKQQHQQKRQLPLAAAALHGS